MSMAATFTVSMQNRTFRVRVGRLVFTLTMSVQFTDAKTNEVIWSNDALTFREEYEQGNASTTGGNPLDGSAFVNQERSSFDRISNDLARTVVTAILEAF